MGLFLKLSVYGVAIGIYRVACASFSIGTSALSPHPQIWFQTGAATTSPVTIAPAYASLLPAVGTVGIDTVLAIAAVAPVRSATGELIAVAASETTVSHFDDFLKEVPQRTGLKEGKKKHRLREAGPKAR